MEVSELLKKAWTAVQEADLPVSIHEVAFREAMRVIAPDPGGRTSIVPPPRGPGRAAGVAPRAPASASRGADSAPDITLSEEEIFNRVVTHTNVDRAKLEELVHLDDGVLKVSIPGIRLGKTNAEKIRAVAQILTIVRGFGLEEDGTAVELVRSETIRLKCYDKANFAAHLGKLNGYVITGSGTGRRIRAKAAGIQAFSAFVDSLLGSA